jgi:hypothetical protein
MRSGVARRARSIQTMGIEARPAPGSAVSRRSSSVHYWTVAPEELVAAVPN